MKELLLLASFALALVFLAILVCFCIACDQISKVHKRLFDE